MRIILLTGLLINTILTIQAQNYQIDFAATGSSSSIDSVKIENLSQCTSLTLAGTDILNLTSTTGINKLNNIVECRVSVYPNPSSGNFSIALESAFNNNVTIVLYNASGKAVLQCKDNIEQGHNIFHLSGLHSGLYFLKIESDQHTYTTKLISNNATNRSPEIHSTFQKNNPNKLAEIYKNLGSIYDNGNKSVIDMQFNAGDTLKLTGKSGIYKTVSMLFPNQSQTVTFNFIRCTDADSNNYAVVQIGNQLWMQENLKATHYRDGSAIPNVTDSAAWGNLTSEAYCNYHNDTAEGAYYGRLYNFYAVDDTRNLCPVGWHVPSNGEWNELEKFLDPTVDTTALMGRGKIIGRILKEGCNTRWQYLDTTYGWNSAGFTALCTNFRSATGGWSLAPDNNHDDAFWSSTSYSSTAAWSLSLRWCFGDIYVLPFIWKKSGHSVRCIKD